jgi:hypothetical protein
MNSLIENIETSKLKVQLNKLEKEINKILTRDLSVYTKEKIQNEVIFYFFIFYLFF